MYVDPILFYIVVFLSGYIVIQHVIKPVIQWLKGIVNNVEVD